ncbi:hypothetical protein PISMIDRAFT_350027 [Pisolithus microcarpus 441]|uniref:Uncharacterized protein n=1 Tax=Pisolithus microcarpus 441 TaxID=765257 RepID=A0A0C9ZZY1_9AGAM|nr:hypothetical protein PISMIDRAFT_350027 [Pisolithus microcarpus 441]
MGCSVPDTRPAEHHPGNCQRTIDSNHAVRVVWKRKMFILMLYDTELGVPDRGELSIKDTDKPCIRPRRKSGGTFVQANSSTAGEGEVHNSIPETIVCSAKSGDTDALELIASGLQKFAETRRMTCRVDKLCFPRPENRMVPSLKPAPDKAASQDNKK